MTAYVSEGERPCGRTAGHDAHVLLPYALFVMVYTVEVLDVVPVVEAQELILEKDVVRAAGAVHQYEVVEILPPVQHVEQQRP
jgi:hypothetical protein